MPTKVLKIYEESMAAPSIEYKFIADYSFIFQEPSILNPRR